MVERRIIMQQMINLHNGHIVDVHSSGIMFGWMIGFLVKENMMYHCFDHLTHQWVYLTGREIYPAIDESVKALQQLKIENLGKQSMKIFLTDGTKISRFVIWTNKRNRNNPSFLDQLYLCDLLVIHRHNLPHAAYCRSY